MADAGSAQPFSSPKEEREADAPLSRGAVLRGIARYLLWPLLLAAPIALLSLLIVLRDAAGPNAVVNGGNETSDAHDFAQLVQDIHNALRANFVVLVVVAAFIRGVVFLVHRFGRRKNTAPDLPMLSTPSMLARGGMVAAAGYGFILASVGAVGVMKQTIFNRGALQPDGLIGQVGLAIGYWMIFMIGYATWRFARSWWRNRRSNSVLLTVAVAAHILLVAVILSLGDR